MYKNSRDKFINSENSTISVNDWNSFILAKSQNKLKDLDENANIYLRRMFDNQLFFNLSLNEIFRNMVIVITLIFYEILALNTQDEIKKRKNMSFSNKFKMYSELFLKDNRIIPVGTFFVLLSMVFMIICITS